MLRDDNEELEEAELEESDVLENTGEPSVVSLRSTHPSETDDGGDEKDKEEEDEEDDEVLDEDDRTSSLAPWGPIPLRRARQFVHDDPSAALEVEFPTVYEEDRSVKLRDLGTVQALGAISHQRMSEQMAKELGFEQYNYKDEMDVVTKERPPMASKGELGDGDDLAGKLFGPDTPQSPGDGGVKRAQVSGPVQAEFRRQQKESMMENLDLTPFEDLIRAFNQS